MPPLIMPLPRLVQKAIDEFSRLPGIGPKSAARLVFYLLRAKPEQTTALSQALQEMRQRVRYCSICYNITTDDTDPCLICSAPDRDPAVVCVVEDVLDVPAIEKTRLYRGHYHVLHGALSPVDGVLPEDLRIKELLARVQGGRVQEVILATNPNLAGQATSMYLHQRLLPLGVRVTRLAQGLPVGGDLGYLDEVTLARALEGRQLMS